MGHRYRSVDGLSPASHPLVIITALVLACLAPAYIATQVVLFNRVGSRQSLVTGECPVGMAIRTVHANGTVECTTRSGWLNLADSEHTSGSPQALASGIRTFFTIDQLGSSTSTDYAYGIPTTIFDNSTLMPEEVGATYHLRVGFTIIPANANSFITLELNIGPDGAGIPILTRTITLPRGAGFVHGVSVAFPIYCLDTFVANGGRLYLTMSAGDSATLYGKNIFILAS